MTSTENKETIEDLITNNYSDLSKMLQVQKLIPQFIQRRLLDLPEKEVIMSKVTTRGKAEALLDLLCSKATCTPEVFVEILKKGDHQHIVDQLKWTSTQTKLAKGPQVFICHAGPDKERFVRPLVQQLQEEGLPEKKIFFDAISLETGDDIEAKIRATLSSASMKLVVFVISRHVLNDRYWPKLEFELTQQANKKIFPIWLDQNDDHFAVFGDRLRRYSPTLKGIVARKVRPHRARREIPSIAEEIVRKLEIA